MTELEGLSYHQRTVSEEETQLGCAMGDDCYCPNGPGWFSDPPAHPPRDWDRSQDHYPTLKRFEGTLEPGNVRLMHVHCNRVDYSNLALEEHLLLLTDSEGRYLDERAVDLAMEEHLQLLGANNGRLPKGRKAWKGARGTAIEMAARLLDASNQTPAASTSLLQRWRQRSTDVMRDEARRKRRGDLDKPASGLDAWKRFVEWQKTLPDRFDRDLAAAHSDYSEHHLIHDATAEEVRQLLEGKHLEIPED